MTKKESIEKFLAPKKIAVVGASANKKKFGYAVFNELRQKGYDICPVNPKLEKIEDVTCYKSVNDIPADYEKVFIVTPKTETDSVIKQAAEKGLRHIWVQQTSNTKDTESIAKELNVDLIQKECIFMFANPVTSIHKFHRAIWRLFGALPK